MTLEVGVDLVILPPLMYCISVVQLTNLIILASDHHLHQPAKDLLGGGAVHGQGAGDQELAQEVSRSREEAAEEVDKSDRELSRAER